MSEYEIIARPFPQSRKKNFFLNFRDLLSFAFLRYLPKSPKPAPTKWTTAPSKEEAIKIGLEILATGQFESVVVQNPEHPEEGAMELTAKKKGTHE